MSPPYPPLTGSWIEQITLEDTPVSKAGSVLCWTGGLVIDDDGDPRCYSPADWGALHGRVPQGRDAPENAVGAWRPGGGRAISDVARWAGVVVGPDGQPVVQGPSDPAPGFWLAQTKLSDPRFKETDPRHWVNAWVVPFLSIPSILLTKGARFGDVAAVEYWDQVVFALIADLGPPGKIGEGSPALARGLGLSDNPRHGGASQGVRTYLFCGSGSGHPLTVPEINQLASPLYERLRRAVA